MRRNQTLVKVRDAVRNPYAWPGGYPVYVVMSDGALMCAKCVRENYRQISASTRHHLRDGWGAEGAEVLWETEGGHEHCANCNQELESAYGDAEETNAA